MTMTKTTSTTAMTMTTTAMATMTAARATMKDAAVDDYNAGAAHAMKLLRATRARAMVLGICAGKGLVSINF